MNFNFFAKTLIVIFATCFLVFVAKHAVNLPYQDDVNLLQTTLIENDAKGLIGNLFSADSDHIQVFPKLAALIQHKIFGLVNYKWLTISMNFLVVLALFFLVNIPQKIKSWFYFLPVFFMLLQPQLYEISFWVLPGLQHSFAFLFMVLAMYFFDLNKKYNTISLIWASCATFCTGNGLLAFFGIIYILLLYKKTIWYALAIFIVCFSVYLISYKPSPAVRSSIDIAYIFRFQAMFWASPFDVFNRQHLHQLAGFMILVILVGFSIYFSWKIYTQKRREFLPYAKLIGILIFCGGTAVLISLSREYDVVFSRFQFYAFIGFIVFYLLILEISSANFQKYFGLTVGFIFCIIVGFSYFSNYIKIENTQSKYLADTFNWRQNKMMMLVDQPFLNLVNETYQKAENSNIKILNETIKPQILNALIQKINIENTLKIDLKLIADPYPRRYFANDHYILSSENFNKKTNLNQHWYIVFATDSIKYLVAPQFSANFKGEFLKTKHYYKNGFYADIPALNFKDGNYKIYLLKSTQIGDYELFKTKNELQIISGKPYLYQL